MILLPFSSELVLTAIGRSYPGARGWPWLAPVVNVLDHDRDDGAERHQVGHGLVIDRVLTPPPHR